MPARQRATRTLSAVGGAARTDVAAFADTPLAGAASVATVRAMHRMGG
jgi:hypothetical protein